jgi:hypothetical protein
VEPLPALEDGPAITVYLSATQTEVTLHFYIDPDHFPYAHQHALDLDNKTLLNELGSMNTWLLWTLRTYLELKSHFHCILTDRMPKNGIIFFFRGSVNLTQKPERGQFWVCMVADSTWHPFSHVNIFQNQRAAARNPRSYFIRHWQQLNIKPSVSANICPKNIAYFGDVANLAPELRSEEWTRFTRNNGFRFLLPPIHAWNDYTDIDIVLGIRSFETSKTYDNKPASKLINAWRANTVFIGGGDSAYADESSSELDYICASSYASLKSWLIKLRDEPGLFTLYQQQTRVCTERFPDAFFKEQWLRLVTEELGPLSQKAISTGWLGHNFFLARGFLRYRLKALAARFD